MHACVYGEILTQGGLVADVFKQNVERLEELDTNITPWLLPQNVQEEGKHVLLQEEAESKITQQIHLTVFFVVVVAVV